MRLKGFDAIVYAEEQGLPLNRFPGPTNEARTGLSVAEAEAIATDDEDLIYLDVPDAEYEVPPPGTYEPER
jgi:hypothetical protein